MKKNVLAIFFGVLTVLARRRMAAIAATVLTVLALVSCKKEELPENNSSLNNEGTTWILTVKANMISTRALTEDSNGLVASFKTTENIYAYNVTADEALTGCLNPQSDGSSVVLSGALTGTINPGDQLRLTYLKSAVDYTGQKGTLEDIAANFDLATATVSVISVESGNVSANAATFVPLQSVTKFSFTDGTNPVVVKSLTISNDNLVTDGASSPAAVIDVTLETAGSSVYVAMSNPSDAKETYIFNVVDENGWTWTGTKKANLQDGAYYTASVTLTSVITKDSPVGQVGMLDGREGIVIQPHYFTKAGIFHTGTKVVVATMNVGATTPEEYGDYFFYDDAIDPAKTGLSDGWRLPTKEEVDDLAAVVQRTTYQVGNGTAMTIGTLDEQNGVKGRIWAIGTGSKTISPISGVSGVSGVSGPTGISGPTGVLLLPVHEAKPNNAVAAITAKPIFFNFIFLYLLFVNFSPNDLGI